MRLISNTNLETLYLNKNKITDFKDCLRIISRTEMIKAEGDIKGQSSFLINLNLSGNNCFNKNAKEIELLSNLIDTTSLYTLDLSNILYGNNPDKIETGQENHDYRVQVDKLKEKLDGEREKYEVIIDNKKCLEVDIKEGEYYEKKYRK